MLYSISDSPILRIVSIDPGTQTAGFSCIDVDLVTRHYHVVDAVTVRGNDMLREFGDLKDIHEERFLRNLGYANCYFQYLTQWSPATICSEAPYMGRFAAAFKALTEQVTVFRAGAYQWDRAQTFNLYEPSVVKKAMGVKGGSKDKEDMRRALAKRTDVSYGNGISLEKLDEHAIDSVCVAIHHAERLNLWIQT